MVVAACALALIPQGAQAQRQNSAQTTSTVITYTVKPGDNDWDLAERFGTTSKEIRRLNPGVNWNSLRPGMKLRIPSRRAASSAPRATQRTARDGRRRDCPQRPGSAAWSRDHGG